MTTNPDVGDGAEDGIYEPPPPDLVSEVSYDGRGRRTRTVVRDGLGPTAETTEWIVALEDAVVDLLDAR